MREKSLIGRIENLMDKTEAPTSVYIIKNRRLQVAPSACLPWLPGKFEPVSLKESSRERAC